MNYFPVCSPFELDTRFYVPVSALIAGDTSGLLVPLYSVRECPSPVTFDVSTYLTDRAPGMLVPIYSNPAYIMTRYSRPVSAITARS